jgi:hypothetical protein
MAPSRLKARLDRIDAAIGAAPPVCHDLSHLEGWEIDRLRELNELVRLKGPTRQLLNEAGEIVARCPILPPGVETKLRPRFPLSLIRYWRSQGSVDPRVPRGYFNHKLCYASRDRLIELCLEYGWNDETGETDAILPIDQWRDADLAELTGILKEALVQPQP